MQVATILPTPLLNAIPKQHYNMCLYQVVKDNPTYAEYFKQIKQAGAFVIMDNGAAEGTNPSAEELLAVYPLVEPSEIVLPDVVWDSCETLERTRHAYELFVNNDLHKKYQFMAVPQGESFNEWLNCMRTMLRQPFITTIGVSKFTTPKFQEAMGAEANVRRECVDAILQEAHALDRPVQIHLLGCWSNPIEIGQIAAIFGDKVRGTDSGIAYVYTRAGVQYKMDIDRPDNEELDFHNGTVADQLLLRRNIKTWVEYCTGN